MRRSAIRPGMSLKSARTKVRLNTNLMPDHRVFLLVLEHALEDWERVDVVDLAEAVGHLVPEQRTLAVKACASTETS